MLTKEISRKFEREMAWSVINNGNLNASKPRRYIAGIAVNSGRKNMHGYALKADGVRVILPTLLLWNHDFARPLGKVHAVEARGSKIHFQAELINSGRVAWVEQVWAAIREKEAVCASVQCAPADTSDANGDLSTWNLDEISVVEIGADPGARILRVWEKAPCVYLDGRSSVTELWKEPKAG